MYVAGIDWTHVCSNHDLAEQSVILPVASNFNYARIYDYLPVSVLSGYFFFSFLSFSCFFFSFLRPWSILSLLNRNVPVGCWRAYVSPLALHCLLPLLHYDLQQQRYFIPMIYMCVYLCRSSVARA